MTQREHLTIEQLSAYLDKQLTPQEQAFFDAHLQSCERCQRVLAELRGTVALLRAMPEPALPRSFTLPADISQEPAPRPRPQPVPLPVQQRRPSRSMLRRTMRAVSTLAAAIAVLFIISGLLAGFHPGGGAATMSNSAPVASGGSAATHPAATSRNLSPQVQPGTPAMGTKQSGTPAKSPVASTPAPTPTTSPSSGTVQTAPTSPPTLPPYLDIGQPEGRLLLGAFLLLLSIAGLIATRRRRQTIW